MEAMTDPATNPPVVVDEVSLDSELVKVVEDKPDSKLSGSQPSIRIDGEPTVNSANKLTASENELKVAEDEVAAKHGAKNSNKQRNSRDTGAAHFLDSAGHELSAAGYNLRTGASITMVGEALQAAGRYLISAELHGAGYGLLAAVDSLISSELSTLDFTDPISSQFGGLGTKQHAETCLLPHEKNAASKTDVMSAIKSSSPPHHIFFSKPGSSVNLVSDSGPNLEFMVTSSPDRSVKESGSIEESDSRSGGSQTGSQEENCPDGIIVGRYKSPSFLKNEYEHQR